MSRAATKKKKEIVFPIQHWSTSSMMDYLTNPLIFKKKWILLIPDDDSGVSAMVGKAAHYALQVAHGGEDKIPVPPDMKEARPIAIQAGLDYLERYPDENIKYGKTGNREKMLQTYNKVINWYFDEMPDWDVVAVEERMQQYLVGPDGTKFALPMKGHDDLLIRKENGRLSIIDHKFVSSYTDPGDEKPQYIVQAMFLYHLVKETHGEAPEDIIFRECKTSENKDGTVQTKEWGIKFDEVPHYFTFFYKLYDDCTKSLAREDAIFLPNFRDLFNGEEAYLIYQQDLLDVDMSDVEIDHNTHHVRFMKKDVQFRQSALDSVDADAYMPEERVRVKLAEFGIPIQPKEVHHGPSVSLYTFAPSGGVSVNRVEKHAKDIALALRAENIRILAPIPGTNLIGVEVPREDREVVDYKPGITKEMEIPIGVDLYGKPVKKDLKKMPHLLIAGATGSGKSVCMNVAITSLTENNTPEEMEMILIDPKQVELTQWEGDPHTRGPVITGTADAVKTLVSVVDEMNARYTKLREAGARSIDKYGAGDMPYLVVVIDEFADLIMSKEKVKGIDMVSGEETTSTVAGSEIEDNVVRIAQKGRAAGIHLIIGTQKPTVNVLTGLIKANIPTRIAFMTSSITDSKVILDVKGAEELLGAGDMLFRDPSAKGLQRLQGYFLE